MSSFASDDERRSNVWSESVCEKSVRRLSQAGVLLFGSVAMLGCTAHWWTRTLSSYRDYGIEVCGVDLSLVRLLSLCPALATALFWRLQLCSLFNRAFSILPWVMISTSLCAVFCWFLRRLTSVSGVIIVQAKGAFFSGEKLEIVKQVNVKDEDVGVSTKREGNSHLKVCGRKGVPRLQPSLEWGLLFLRKLIRASHESSRQLKQRQAGESVVLGEWQRNISGCKKCTGSVAG